MTQFISLFIQDESESTTSSNLKKPSVTSLRARPSNATFIPIEWEIKMGELLDATTSHGNTLSILKNAAARGNDDRDQFIADEVATGRKVKVGRFMVQKSTIQEESESDSYHDGIEGGMSTEDENQLSWVERRETRIRRSMRKDKILENRAPSDHSSTEGSGTDGDEFNYCKDKETLLKKRKSSIPERRRKPKRKVTSKHIPERNRAPSGPLPAWDFDSEDDKKGAAASQKLVRPRSMTTPFMPNTQITSDFEWDFSDDDDTSSAKVASSADVIPFQNSLLQDGPQGDNHVPQNVGRFTVQQVSTPETGTSISPQSHEQKDNPQGQGNDVALRTTARFGRFIVQSVQKNDDSTPTTDQTHNIQSAKMSESIDRIYQDEVNNENRNVQYPEVNQFDVQKVDVKNVNRNQQQDSGVISCKKGRFTVQTITERTNKEEQSASNDKTKINLKQGISDITKANQNVNNLSLKPSDTTTPRKTVGRFNIEKVETPELQTNLGIEETKNHPDNEGNSSIPRFRPGTGRFAVLKVRNNDDDSLKEWEYPRDHDDDDDDDDETAPMLLNVQLEKSYSIPEESSSRCSTKADENSSYLETAL